MKQKPASHASNRLLRPIGSSSVHNADRRRDLRNALRLSIDQVARGNYSDALEQSAQLSQRTIQRKCSYRSFLRLHSNLRVQLLCSAVAGVRASRFWLTSQLQTTPHAVLNLQPGELVRIKSKHEIEQTLNAQFKNRGLWFDKEMTRFCGGNYRVRSAREPPNRRKIGQDDYFYEPVHHFGGRDSNRGVP